MRSKDANPVIGPAWVVLRATFPLSHILFLLSSSAFFLLQTPVIPIHGLRLSISTTLSSATTITTVSAGAVAAGTSSSSSCHVSTSTTYEAFSVAKRQREFQLNLAIFCVGRPPPPGADPQLWYWFEAVDTDGSGYLTVDELQRALINGDWTPFNIETVRMMVNMFDTGK